VTRARTTLGDEPPKPCSRNFCDEPLWETGSALHHLGLGKLYRRTDNRKQTQEHLSTATAMYREMGMTYCWEQAAAETAGLG